jgi:hypothetical protein
MFIPLTAIFMSLLIPIVSAIVGYRRRRDIVEAHHKERMAAIERGIDIPPLPDAFYLDADSGRKPRTLMWGLIWLFVGIALFVSLQAVVGTDIAFFGLIPGAIGLAMLIYYLVEGRKDTGGEHAANAAPPVA